MYPCPLHPFVIYIFKKNSEICHKSVVDVVIAESLKHNFVSVSLFQKKVISFMYEQFQVINKIYFFSDGTGPNTKVEEKFKIFVTFLKYMVFSVYH